MTKHYNPMPFTDTAPHSPELAALKSCIHHMDELLDEEFHLLEQGNLNDLDRLNIRKTLLLGQFTALSKLITRDQIETFDWHLEPCRRKSERSFEALSHYLCAMEDLNRIIFDEFRKRHSDGTYSRPAITHSYTKR